MTIFTFYDLDFELGPMAFWSVFCLVDIILFTWLSVKTTHNKPSQVQVLWAQDARIKDNPQVLWTRHVKHDPNDTTNGTNDHEMCLTAGDIELNPLAQNTPKLDFVTNAGHELRVRVPPSNPTQEGVVSI